MDSEQLREIEEKHSFLAETHTGSMEMEDFLYKDLPPVFMALREAWDEKSNWYDAYARARAKVGIQEDLVLKLQAEKEGNAEAYERMVLGRQRLKNEIIILRGELAEARRVNNKLKEGTFVDPDESVVLKYARDQRDGFKEQVRKERENFESARVDKNKHITELQRQLKEAWAKEDRFKKAMQEYKCAYGYTQNRTKRIERERDLLRTEVIELKAKPSSWTEASEKIRDDYLVLLTSNWELEAENGKLKERVKQTAHNLAIARGALANCQI